MRRSLAAVGIELKATLKGRKLLIPLNAKNAKNTQFAQLGYTTGTRAYQVALAPLLLCLRSTLETPPRHPRLSHLVSLGVSVQMGVCESNQIDAETCRTARENSPFRNAGRRCARRMLEPPSSCRSQPQRVFRRD